MVTGAAAGKHAPAKEWLTHARALEPVQIEQPQGAKVAIIIGQPGAPIMPEGVQVLTLPHVSGSDESAS